MDSDVDSIIDSIDRSLQVSQEDEESDSIIQPAIKRRKTNQYCSSEEEAKTNSNQSTQNIGGGTSETDSLIPDPETPKNVGDLSYQDVSSTQEEQQTEGLKSNSDLKEATDDNNDTPSSSLNSNNQSQKKNKNRNPANTSKSTPRAALIRRKRRALLENCQNKAHLDGKYFKVVLGECSMDGRSITARCQLCTDKRKVKGSLRPSSNFISHLKVGINSYFNKLRHQVKILSL